MWKSGCFGFVFSVVSSSVFAQIPTTDALAIAQDAANNTLVLAQWASQIQEMKNQYDQMTRDFDLAQTQYQSMTGSRGLGSVNYDPGLTDSIANPNNMWNSTSSTQTIIQNERLSGNASSMRAAIEQRSRQVAASRKAASLEAFAGAQQRLSQIEQLMSRINTTSDQKAIQELQARIQIEQAALTDEQNRHQINTQAALAEEALVREQKQEFNRRILDPSIQAMPSIR